MDRVWDKRLNNIRSELHFIWLVYLFAMTALLPLYLDLRTGYEKIDLDKFNFFWTTSTRALGIFTLSLIFYVLVQSGKWYKNKHAVLPHRILTLNSLKKELSVTDLFALLYAASLISSYCFSRYQEETLIGAEGWYMGLLPQLILILAYFTTSRLVTIREVKWVGYMIMTASSLVFLLALLNRYGMNPLKLSKTDPGFLSTIGNINWLCGYWSAVFPLGCGLFWLGQNRVSKNLVCRFLHRFFLVLVLVIGLAVAILQGSESGILTLVSLILLMGWVAGGQRTQLIGFLEILLLFSGVLTFLRIIHIFLPDKNTLPTPLYSFLMETPLLWVMLSLTLLCYFLLQSQKYGDCCFGVVKGVWKAGTIFFIAALVVYVIMVAANTMHPGCLGILSNHPAFLFDENWGNARGGTLRAGISTWSSQDLLHRFVGVGPDGMAAYIYGGENFSLLKTVVNQFGQYTLTNAHNEWITLLANSGLIGVFSFGGMIISSIARYFKSNKVWCMVCGFCLFSYTINNMFSFQQIMNITQMFILLGMGEAVMRRKGGEAQ